MESSLVDSAEQTDNAEQAGNAEQIQLGTMGMHSDGVGYDHNKKGQRYSSKTGLYGKPHTKQHIQKKNLLKETGHSEFSTSILEIIFTESFQNNMYKERLGII